jgi:pyruvate-ferredoxin/flavodoxin oxidoreductase
LEKDEVDSAPNGFVTASAKGKGMETFEYRIQTAVLDCVGCGSCADVCPAKEKAITMQPLDEHRQESANWDYAMALRPKDNPMSLNTVKGSQFEQPLLEFPGACPGCGETPYAKLVTQLFGNRMCVATATGCSAVWATSFPSFPYTTNHKGQGPAAASSLFENNAEYGMGIWLSYEQQRERLKMNVEKFVAVTAESELKTSALEWLENYNEPEASEKLGDQIKNLLDSFVANDEERPLVDLMKDNVDHLNKKSVWLFGGDGWAYDIGFGGLDHVLASEANVNVLVFDTEIYSNTGGQASKATPTGAVAQFAASGKRQKKKDLGLMAMSYENIYVAQVAMGANQSQLLKAMIEAEKYDGPSLIIAYAPCISHGLRSGMNKVQQEIKRAVEVGYWHLYRYNPELIEKGENPFMLDSKEPTGDFREFLRGEVRFTSLERTFPDVAEELFSRTEAEARARYKKYKSLAN